MLWLKGGISVTLHENLKNLRLAAGMTQEQAAAQLGMTRQGLSGYETGRTRPDVETLQRLAEIYGTDLEGVIYGRSRESEALRTEKVSAVILGVLLAVLTFIGSAALWTANRFFPVLDVDAEAFWDIWNVHVRFSGTWELLGRLSLTLCFLGPLFLLIYSAVKRIRYERKTRLLWAFAVSAAMLLVSVLFGATDRVFHVIDYLLVPLYATGRLFFFTALDILIECIQKRKATAPLE